MKYAALALLLALSSCTSNPVGDNAVAGSGTTIAGTVKLSHKASPEGARIWLEGFNLSTKADANGNFSISLPPAGSQNINGVFRLFAYVCNYALESREFAVRNGVFIPGEAGLGADGRLSQDIKLSRQLSIRVESTVVRLENQNSVFFFSAKVFLQANGGSVNVFFPVLANEIQGPLFLRNLETGKVSIISTTIAGLAKDTLSVDALIQTRQMVAFLPFSNFPAGDYEVVPYLLVRDPEVPENLIASIAPEAQALSPDYLQMPFVRIGGIVTIPVSDNDPTQAIDTLPASATSNTLVSP